MLDDFFTRAIIAGIGIAIIAGPLGCFIVWRRMAYFGDTLAHAALLGVAVALFAEANLTITVFVVSATISILLLLMQRGQTLSSDTILGLLSHSSLALGLVAIAFFGATNGDVNAILFGDILGVNRQDIAMIYGGCIVVLVVLAAIWKPLFAATVSPELYRAEGGDPTRVNLIFMLLIAAVIALAMKIVGVLLITAMLIIPVSTARRLSSTPEQMAAISVLIGIIAVLLGMYTSLYFDTPSSPSIVVSALALFILVSIPLRLRKSQELRN